MRHQHWLLCLGLLAALAGVGKLPARAAPHAAATNLVADGGFESGTLAEWETCGGVGLADGQTAATALGVKNGRYALRMGGPTDGSCGDVLNTQQVAQYKNTIRVPSDASGLTLSFWYSRMGLFGQSSVSWDLHVLFVTSDGGSQLRISERVDADASGGWNLARWELSPDDVAAARGRTFRLSFDISRSIPVGPEFELAYHIDELQVLPAKLRTPLVATPPAALADTNTRPLIGVASVGGQLQTVRADLDGSDVQPVYANSFGNGAYAARWSSNGARLATLDHTLQAEPGEPVSINSAQVSALHMFNADGSGRREVLRTSGKKLVPGLPPGCRAPRTDCVRYDDPALDVLITDFDWSPGDERIAVNICSTSRYADGFTSDPICRLQLVAVANGAPQGEIAAALGVSWSSSDRLLYRIGYVGLLDTPEHGIWEADGSLAPSGRRQLLRHKLPIDEDVAGTWAPDGRRFVTLRYVEGNHYNSQGQREYNSALMLWDRQAAVAPRQLVLVDWGSALSSPTWSPDGAYLLFSVRGTAGWETYWLDVATGATGLLAGDLIFAEWRPGAAALSRRVFVPSASRR